MQAVTIKLDFKLVDIKTSVRSKSFEVAIESISYRLPYIQMVLISSRISYSKFIEDSPFTVESSSEKLVGSLVIVKANFLEFILKRIPQAFLAPASSKS